MRTAARVVEALRRATGEPLTGPVGVGVPGLVDVERGRGQARGQPRPRRRLLPLRDLLADRLGVPGRRRERRQRRRPRRRRAQRRADDLVYLSVGTGLAAGLVLDGRLRRGEHGAAGEIGHVPVDPAGALCRCGQRGCLETIASGSALAAAWPSGGRAARRGAVRRGRGGRPAAVAVRDRFAGGVASASGCSA